MKTILFTLSAVALLGSATQANTISESQQKFIKQYEKQNVVPKPEAMLLNTDPEPELCCGFTPLYNGKDLTGWTPLGGHGTFEAQGDVIVGTCIKGGYF